jgi:hypothetical protein
MSVELSPTELVTENILEPTRTFPAFTIPKTVNVYSSADHENDDPRFTFRAHTEGIATKLIFDGVNSTIANLSLTDFTYTTAEQTSNGLNVLAALQRVHTAACRLDAHHPRHASLVPHRHSLKSERRNTVDMFIDAVNLSYGNGGAARELLAQMPEEFINFEFGWFSPDVDPTKFGTYYLVPTGYLDGQRYTYRNAADAEPLAWALRQVGIDGTISTSPWNDQEAINDATQRVLTEDLDTAMTIRALTDSETVSASLREHERRQSTLAARTAFVARKLRPRLVPDTINVVLREADLYSKLTWSGLYTTGTRMLELNDTEIFGWPQPQPIAAAYRVGFEEDLTKTEFADIATRIQNALAPRNLGKVIIDTSRRNVLWVCTDLDLFTEYAAAFSVPSDAHLALAG